MGDGLLEGRRQGAHVFGTDGRRFLDGDGSAGTYNLGRRHPDLARELQLAARETDQGNFPIISIEKARLGEALASFLGGRLECCLFGVTRGEAFDAACKVARGLTRRQGLVAAGGGWHGQTGFALSLSERSDRALFEPLVPKAATVPFGDLAAADRAVGPDTAAFLLEPLQAENRCRAASPEYLRGIARICRDRGALLVLDETQTNFGRTGARFLFERLGVEPDVLVLGEALGGGMFPITATVTTQRVNAFLNEHPLIHLSTFGGSDVGCRVAMAALRVYRREQPWRNAAAVGERLCADFARLAGEFPSVLVGAEGTGLLWSLATPSEAAARALCASCLAHGLLVTTGRVARETVVLRPSLLITEDESGELLAALEAALRDLARQP